jgi:predicted ATPase
VGRRTLLADVREHLASSRVVTLVGPGGVGKTRVALKIVETGRRTYRDGCWVAPLADLSEPELLVPYVAEAIGLQGADRPWQLETLADHLADRTALLVLDNCEHLLEAVGELVEGLRATCPNLRFLLTSRRPLRLSGEDVVVVPPLGLPDEATTATPESIGHHEAVQLFLDRATSAHSGFRLTVENAAAVVALCRDLEGLPLAIELAAARVRALSPQEIRDSLAERLKTLTLGTETPTRGTSR